jgi:hypothetical protein
MLLQKKVSNKLLQLLTSNPSLQRSKFQTRFLKIPKRRLGIPHSKQTVILAKNKKIIKAKEIQVIPLLAAKEIAISTLLIITKRKRKGGSKRNWRHKLPTKLMALQESS